MPLSQTQFKSLKIPEFQEVNPIAKKIPHVIFKLVKVQALLPSIMSPIG